MTATTTLTAFFIIAALALAQACPPGHLPCGTACYRTAEYCCVQGHLKQIAFCPASTAKSTVKTAAPTTSKAATHPSTFRVATSSTFKPVAQTTSSTAQPIVQTKSSTFKPVAQTTSSAAQPVVQTSSSAAQPVVQQHRVQHSQSHKLHRPRHSQLYRQHRLQTLQLPSRQLRPTTR